jgi:hypothetical protein
LAANTAFLACYLPGRDRSLDNFLAFLKILEYGRTTLTFDNKITLPAARQFPGALRLHNNENFEIEYCFFGDPTWRTTRETTATRRIFLYSETDFDNPTIVQMQNEAQSLGHDLQFRGSGYVEGRSKFEKPQAFISHDTRDKDSVARPIAITLQKMLCPVWYDEFSLKVGDSLRESVEKGLKECKKCILVLSPQFLSNNGWTKREFNSIFTREILENSRLVLPVWLGVTKEQVYNYSPSLLDVKAVIWEESKQEDVCRQLHRAIID